MDAHNDNGHDACTALLNPAQFGHALHKPATVHAIGEKAEATLVAEFALAGVELVKMADGSWLASRWGMFKPLTTAAEARAWLARVTGVST